MRSVPATICRRSSCLHTTSTHRGAGTSPSSGWRPGLHSARHSLAALYQNRSILYLGAAGSAPHGAAPHRIGVQAPPVPGHAGGKRARGARAAPAHHPQGAAQLNRWPVGQTNRQVRRARWAGRSLRRRPTQDAGCPAVQRPAARSSCEMVSQVRSSCGSNWFCIISALVRLA